MSIKLCMIPSVQNIQVNRGNDGITSVRLNLVNTEHLKSLLKYIASHSHNIELCVVSARIFHLRQILKLYL